MVWNNSSSRLHSTWSTVDRLSQSAWWLFIPVMCSTHSDQRCHSAQAPIAIASVQRTLECVLPWQLIWAFAAMLSVSTNTSWSRTLSLKCCSAKWIVRSPSQLILCWRSVQVHRPCVICDSRRAPHLYRLASIIRVSRSGSLNSQPLCKAGESHHFNDSWTCGVTGAFATELLELDL